MSPPRLSGDPLLFCPLALLCALCHVVCVLRPVISLASKAVGTRRGCVGWYEDAASYVEYLTNVYAAVRTNFLPVLDNFSRLIWVQGSMVDKPSRRSHANPRHASDNIFLLRATIS